MKIGITGATGFIGGEIARLARDHRHHVVGFSRNPGPHPDLDEMRRFSPEEPVDLDGLDAIVHLAGESIMGIWTPPKKRRIRGSRVEGTRRVVEALNGSAHAPRIFVCGSAIGIYGDTGEIETDESSPAGAGFLPDVAREWEAEASRAANARVVNLRTGFVIGDGGAMKLMAPVFRTGLGGKIGDGRQWMSCIHVADVAGIVLHAIENDPVSGPLNAVVPDPVRNADFTRIVAKAAHRPAIIPVPSLALKIALGELSTLLLDSQRVRPTRTLESGYRYGFPTVASAIDQVFRAG